jgi:hypothetical protein
LIDNQMKHILAAIVDWQSNDRDWFGHNKQRALVAVAYKRIGWWSDIRRQMFDNSKDMWEKVLVYIAAETLTINS